MAWTALSFLFWVAFWIVVAHLVIFFAILSWNVIDSILTTLEGGLVRADDRIRSFLQGILRWPWKTQRRPYRAASQRGVR